MAKRLIYVGPEDDVSDLAGKMQAAEPGDEVALVVPPGAQAFQSPLNVRLLRSVGSKRGVTASVVTPDPRIQELARSVGAPAYSSVAAYQSGVPLGVRPAGPAPYRGPAPPPRPQAPFLPRAAAPLGQGAGTVPASGAPPVALPGPWTPPATSQSPWDTPVGPPRARTPEGPAAAAPPTPFAPRPGTAWTPEPAAPDWEEPPPPWAAARSGAVIAPGVAGTVRAPLPGYPSAPPPGPPGRGTLPGRPPLRPPSRTRALLHNRTALVFIAVTVVVIGLIAFLVLSPSALVTVTVAEQPLTVNATIQGSATPPTSGASNFVQSTVVSDTKSQQFQVTPTGTQAVPAVAATGSVVLSFGASSSDYTTGATGTIPANTEFQTASNPPVVFSSTQNTFVTIPPDGGPSTPPILVSAITAGSSGNVSAGAIQEWPGCNNQLSCAYYPVLVSNPAATTGGVDATTETVASASDVASWQDQLNQTETTLTGIASADLSAKAGQNKPAIDPNGDGKSISFVVTPTSFSSVAAGTVMTAETVTVAMTAQETVYDPSAVKADVLSDLEKSTNLPAGDTLITSQLALNNLQIIQAGSDGTFALSVQGVDYYRPAAVSLGQLRSQLTGHNPDDVATIIGEQIPDVRSVTVHVSPVQLFFMPLFSSNIQIVETYETPGDASSSSTG
jgi:hypothetical protein